MVTTERRLYASWEIIPGCDLACDHCYSTYEENVQFGRLLAVVSAVQGKPWERLNADLIDRGLANLQAVGLKYMNFEGGEPSLRPDLVKLVGLAKVRMLETFVSTHGMYLLQGNLAGQLRDVDLDTLGLSLDGASANVNNAIRHDHQDNPTDHFEKVLNFFEWYKWESESGRKLFRLKINTVVIRSNLHDVRNLGLLLEMALPKQAEVQLKLIQVHPLGRGRSNYASLGITDAEFSETVRAVRKSCPFPVVERRYHGEKVYPFIVVTFSGDIVIPRGEIHEQVAVDGQTLNVLKDDFVPLFERWLEKNPDFLIGNQNINTYTK